MRIGRTLYALVLLFVGVMALLLLRYEPWIYTGILDHPIVAAILAGMLALFIGMEVFQRVPDPKRAVIFRGGRFDRIDPRGELMLLPGTEIGAEIALNEQRIPGWTVVLYDCEGKDVSAIFSMTWRLVPTGTHPRTEREKRAMLMSNGERQDIVIHTLETALRGIARYLTRENLLAVLVDPDFVEGVRKHLCALLEADALTVDRLFLLHIMPPQKKDETNAVRETREVTQTRHWASTADGTPPSVVRGLIAGGPPAASTPPAVHGGQANAQPNVQVGGHDNIQVNGRGAATGADDGHADAKVTFDETLSRQETITRGIVVKPDKGKKDEPPRTCQRCGQVIVVCGECGQPAGHCGHWDPKAVPPCQRCGEPARYCITCGQPEAQCPRCGATRANQSGQSS